ncbi:cbb3-type cytochrome c oxidase subunit I [Komagataeibacter nataicola]|nr:cbb3-type cytochrome c oxidase subunit I [Komagataeibacter nataicola]WEQ54635.1 cbb3-type cytochrome c oxidase subunit I [Komagataeibacter nataicola]WNM09003.1 cbb3-type cytochrome c oxidase subunit I [Komagataeibacter nataicola]GBR13899.1 cytochrome c oxidase subunit 1 [Komagataeibacter nataicola NRIC 0616]
MPTGTQFGADAVQGTVACRYRTIGMLYLVMAIVAGLVGGLLAVGLQAGLLPHALIEAWAGGDTPGAMERIARRHGMMMVFFCALPALTGGFGNWFVPLLLRARALALPRLALAGWGLVAASFVAVLAGLSPALPAQVSLLALLGWCLGMLMQGICMVATVLNMGPMGQRLRDLPLFVWAQGLAGMMAVMVMPVMAGGLTRIWLGGGDISTHIDVLLHAFSGPEIALLLLPSIGIVSQVVETFCDRPLQMPRLVLGALVVMSVGGGSVWVHDLLHGGLAHLAAPSPAVQLGLIVVPVLVVLVAWAQTVRLGHMRASVPMEWAVGFVALLLAGSVMSLRPGGMADVHAATLYAAVFALFAGFYYWIGKMVGHVAPVGASRLHFGLTVGGTVLSLLAFHGAPGVLGAVLMGLSVLVFAGIVVQAGLRPGRPLPDNYWGPGARTAEWQVSSPAREKA